MNVDIYIKERNGSREIRIPWLPETINVKSGGTTVASYDIMNKGEVAVPTGTGLVTVSWASEFPGANRTDQSMLRGKWNKPSYYNSILEDWRKNGTPLNILVTGYPINYDVFLSDYASEATGGFGDLAYDLTFTEDRDLTIGTTKNSAAGSAGENGTRRSMTTVTSYTIKKGDTLWTIAEKLLGSGARWKEIYNANKEIIERVAKSRWKAAGVNRDSENGHWIFPGTVITIPGTTSSTGSSGASSGTSGSGTPKSTGSSGGASGSGGSGSSTGKDTTFTLSIVNSGSTAYWGTFNVYVNAVRKRSGAASNCTVSVEKGDRVTIAATGKDGHGCSISESSFKVSGNKTVTITWKR